LDIKHTFGTLSLYNGWIISCDVYFIIADNRVFDDEEERQMNSYMGEDAEGFRGDLREPLSALSAEIRQMLKLAFDQGEIEGEIAQKVCQLHREWICYFWGDYSEEAHIYVTEQYVDDARYQAYFDHIAPGSAAFLRDAVKFYCKNRGGGGEHMIANFKSQSESLLCIKSI
jgi:hypothetical protein